MNNHLKLLGGLGLALSFGISAHAQTAATPAPAPAPAWKQGMSADQANSTLAPLPGKLVATKAADVPIDKIKLPPGFKVEVWADSIPGGRAIAEGENGKYYVGTRGLGRVYEITDTGSERTSRVFVDKLQQPTVAYKDGSLYVVAINQVLRYDDVAKNPNAQPVDLTANFNFPPLPHHNWKYVAFGPDGKLYVPFGAPCNICELPTDEYAQLRRYNPDGTGMEVLATGIRNTVGFDWHPTSKELWFSNHGRDWMGDDLPEDTMHRLKMNANYGFPYCHQGNVPDPDVTKPNPCAGVEPPVALMGPHSATMGVTFYTGDMFPPEYRNVLFNARKGSWNRTERLGYDVVTVRSDVDGKNSKVEPFMTGFMNPADQSWWGRPAYMHQMKDGSMLVSDEQNGVIYRVTYSK